MDELDSAILRELQADGRLSNRELAGRLGLAPSTCLVRTRALREQGILTGFHAEVDLAKIGRGVQALIAFTIRPLSRDVIRGFETFALRQPEVLAVFRLGGSDDFLVHVATPTIAAMHALMVDHFSARKEVIGFRTSIIYNHLRRFSVEPVPPESVS